jgi:hypothetical protein
LDGAATIAKVKASSRIQTWFWPAGEWRSGADSW